MSTKNRIKSAQERLGALPETQPVPESAFYENLNTGERKALEPGRPNFFDGVTDDELRAIITGDGRIVRADGRPVVWAGPKRFKGVSDAELLAIVDGATE